MKQFWQHVLGPTEPGLFAACIFFAAVGVFLVLLLGTTLRKKDSPHSPISFSWSYLWSDNARRIYASAIAVLVTLRFMPEVLNMTLKPWTAFCVGMAWDSILLIVKQKTEILDPKSKT